MEAAKIIPADKIHVSKMNVRYGIPFGESEEDKALIESVRKGKIVQPFKMRPEGNGFGVYVGGRRFQAKKAVGTQKFVERQDMTINQIDDDQARTESIVENLELFRKDMDPWTRAKGLQQIIDLGVGLSQRTIAKALGIPHSTLSEYVSVLQLHGDFQRLIKEDKLGYMDARKLVKLKLGELQEEELAKVLDGEGLDAYYAALAKLTSGKVERRGVPRGKYFRIGTIPLEKRNKEHMKLLEGLEKLAKAQNKTVPEIVFDVLREKIRDAFG